MVHAMNENVRRILSGIARLEDELASLIQAQQEQLHYRIEGSRQILSRTESYWCPIKHARKVLAPHRHYAGFADFGDGEEFEAHAGSLREQVRAGQ